MTGVGADFAWRLMKSQGWSDGDGLGKARQGRKQALKPKLKFDQHGLGHDRAAEFEFHWWDHVFNSAVKGVTVNNSDSGEVTVEFKADKSEISAKKLRRRMQKEMRHKLYSRFIKSGTLEGSTLITSGEEVESLTEVQDLSQIKNMTDDDLVKACGGRTAHKGARHGQKMNAKLKRVEESELAFIAAIQAKQKEKEAKKLKSSAKLSSAQELPTNENAESEIKPKEGTEDDLTESGQIKKRKKKKKDKDRNFDHNNKDEGFFESKKKKKENILTELNEDCDKKKKKREKIKDEAETIVDENCNKEKKKTKKRKRDKEKIEEVIVNNEATGNESTELDENLHKKKKKKKKKSEQE